MDARRFDRSRSLFFPHPHLPEHLFILEAPYNNLALAYVSVKFSLRVLNVSMSNTPNWTLFYYGGVSDGPPHECDINYSKVCTCAPDLRAVSMFSPSIRDTVLVLLYFTTYRVLLTALPLQNSAACLLRLLLSCACCLF